MNNTIYGRFHNEAVRNHAQIAVIDERQRVTYAELDRLTDVIIAKFKNKEPKLVAVVMDHSVEMIASILAILKAGGAYIPIEPSFPRDRINYILDESNADFVITNKRHSSLAGKRNKILIDSLSPKSEAEETVNKSKPKGLAYILYTSGTTGKPKGVMVENRNVCHYARAFENEFHIGKDDVMLQYSVCTFDIFVEEVFATLLNGACLAIPSAHDRKDVASLMKFVERHNVTIISGFPYLLLDINKLASLPSSLRLLISGGDVLRASYVDRLLPKVDIYNTYGPSETTVCATYYRCNGNEPMPDGAFSIGKAVKGVKVSILDDDMREVPVGAIGEICIEGDGVSRGYLKTVPESANFILSDDGKRMYRSGDMGYVNADGNIAFLHRKDSQVMIEGKRVECGEVENRLCACDEIECGVVRSGVDKMGLSYLIAYFVPKRPKISIAVIKRKLSAFLPSFMIPEFFVSLTNMPLTTNGKVDFQALPVVAK